MISACSNNVELAFIKESSICSFDILVYSLLKSFGDISPNAS